MAGRRGLHTVVKAALLGILPPPHLRLFTAAAAALRDCRRRWKTSCECVAASTPVIALRADSRDTDSPRQRHPVKQVKCKQGGEVQNLQESCAPEARRGQSGPARAPTPGRSRSTASRRGAGR